MPAPVLDAHLWTLTYTRSHARSSAIGGHGADARRLAPPETAAATGGGDGNGSSSSSSTADT